MLTKSKILEEMNNGNIVIEPFNLSQLNTNSYNFTLSDKLLAFTKPLDMKKANEPDYEITLTDEGYVLEPGVLYLGSTVEYTKTNNYVACIDGRSSTARLGIQIHSTGGFGDIGFEGTWTLEISVTVPVRIYPGVEIGQIYYFKPEGEIKEYYDGRYQGQVDPTPSRFHQ